MYVYPIFSTTVHPTDLTHGGYSALLVTRRSAVSSIKVFGGAVLEKAASHRRISNGHKNGHCAAGSTAEDPRKCSVERGVVWLNGS